MTHHSHAHSAIENLKANLRNILHPHDIQQACRQKQYHWRQRKLGPVETIWMFALQILHGNTACTHAARLIPGTHVSDTAYCQARSRLPIGVFRTLARLITR